MGGWRREKRQKRELFKFHRFVPQKHILNCLMNELKWAWSWIKAAFSFTLAKFCCWRSMWRVAWFEESERELLWFLQYAAHSILCQTCKLLVSRWYMYVCVERKNSILCLIDWWHQQTTNDIVLSCVRYNRSQSWEDAVKLFCWLALSFQRCELWGNGKYIWT